MRKRSRRSRISTKKTDLSPSWATGLLVSLAAILVFRRAALGSFMLTWDDPLNIFENPHIRGLDWEHLRWMFFGSVNIGRYKPLVWLSHALNYRWGGLDPFGYHLVDVALHAANALLVFWLIRELLSRRAGDGHRPLLDKSAAFGALLWALHPLRVEVVAWATNARTYGQSVFFLLAAALCYLRFTRPEEKNKKFHYGFSVFFFLISVLSYPVAPLFPLVLLVLDIFVLERLRKDGRSLGEILIEKIPFCLVSGLFLVTLLGRTQTLPAWGSSAASFDSFGPARIMQSFYIWAYYLWRPFWPFHLSPVYTRLFDFSATDGAGILSLLAVLAGTYACLRLRRRHPYLLGAWLCHLILLAPFLGLTETTHFSNDRYSTLCALAWAALGAAGFYFLRAKTGAAWAAAALIVFLAHRSAQQTLVWNSSVSLFRHIVSELGNQKYAASIWWRLSYAYLERGDEADALASAETALRLDPDDVQALALRAAFRIKQKNFKAADEDYHRACRVEPDADLVRRKIIYFVNFKPERKIRPERN